MYWTTAKSPYKLAVSTYSAPSVNHACRSIELEGFILHFSPSFLRQPLPTDYRVSHGPPEDLPFLTELCGQLLRDQGQPAFAEAALHLLLLREASYQHETEGNGLTSTDRLVDGFLQLARTHCTHKRATSWYAERLFTTTGHLNARVRARTGSTCGEHLRNHLLRQAQHRLTYTTDSASEIATALGFQGRAYFWRWFKRHLGVTPGAYRSSVHK